MRSVAGEGAAYRAVAVAGSGIARTAEAGEDLPANRIVPVAERRPSDVRRGRPRAAAQHFVLGAEEHLRVLGIREGLVARIAAEVRRRPLPHVADHAVAPDRRHVLRVRADLRGAEAELVDVRVLARRTLVTPGVELPAAERGIPRRRSLPFLLRGQALADRAGVRLGLVEAHVTDRLQRVERCDAIHRANEPA